MKNRLLAILVMTSLVMGAFTACGGNKTETEDGQKTSESAEVVEIEYLNHKTETEAIEAMDQLIAKFEAENPNIKVTQTTDPDFSTVITTRAQTNDMPDVFSCSTSNTYEQMFADGLIMDLTGQEFLNNVSESTLKLSEYQGSNWRMPYALSLYGLYIRTDMFEENGIEIPNSYEELVAACDKLHSVGITPYLCADQDSGVVGQRMERLMGIIDDSDDEFKAIVDGSLDPKDSVVLNKYADTQIDIANNTTADSMGVDQESSYQNFVNGDGAMLINGTWTLATLKSYDKDINVVMIPFPNPTGDKTKVPMSIDTSFCISAETEHPDECLKFLDFLSQTENAQIYCNNEGSPNVINGVDYNVEEFSSMMEKVNAGDIFVSLNAIWPSGLRNEMRDYAGTLIMDKNKDEFVNAAAELLPNYYIQ